MKEIDIKYGMEVCIKAKGRGIYILGHTTEEAIDILSNNYNVYEESKWHAIDILRKAQECNASLREIKSIYGKETLSISFEFETWEDFLSFKQIIEKHSHY